MTTKPAITVDGDENLARTSKAAADDLADMDTSNRAIGELVRARAASGAPKVTGTLAGSVYVASVSAADVVIASDLVYAPRINYGWPAGSLPAQPFLTNAMREGQSAIIARYADDTNDAVSHIRGT